MVGPSSHARQEVAGVSKRVGTEKKGLGMGWEEGDEDELCGRRAVVVVDRDRAGAELAKGLLVVESKPERVGGRAAARTLEVGQNIPRTNGN